MKNSLLFNSIVASQKHPLKFKLNEKSTSEPYPINFEIQLKRLLGNINYGSPKETSHKSQNIKLENLISITTSSSFIFYTKDFITRRKFPTSHKFNSKVDINFPKIIATFSSQRLFLSRLIYVVGKHIYTFLLNKKGNNCKIHHENQGGKMLCMQK